MRRLLLFALLIVLLAACGGNATPAAPAPAATTTPPAPTHAPTATVTPAPTRTPSPTPRPPAVAAAERLIAPYAQNGQVETSQTEDGQWVVRFTTPDGQQVEMKDVSAEGRAMERQNWVENYNEGRILLEGRDEQERLWRLVEQNGERMLMYDHQSRYSAEWTRYFWWAYDKNTGEFGAQFEAPGNGHVEMLKVHKEGDQWVDENGNPFAMSEFGQKYADHYHIEEVEIPMIVIDDWKVMVLEAKDGHEYVVREGKLLVDGQEVAVPEVAGNPKPKELMYNADQRKWYVGDWGLAFWKIEDGQVVKYDRPVAYGVDLEVLRNYDRGHSEWLDFKDSADRVERIGNEPKIYQPPQFQHEGHLLPYGVVMAIKVPKWDQIIDVVVNGFLMEGYKVLPPNDNAWGLVMWVPMPFGDEVMDAWNMLPNFEVVAANGEVKQQDNALMGMDGFMDYVNQHRPVPMIYVQGYSNKSEDFMNSWLEGIGGDKSAPQHWFFLDMEE